jgi:hypothetical protein
MPFSRQQPIWLALLPFPLRFDRFHRKKTRNSMGESSDHTGGRAKDIKDDDGRFL